MRHSSILGGPPLPRSCATLVTCPHPKLVRRQLSARLVHRPLLKPRVLFIVRRPRFRHPEPNDKDQAQRYTGNADESNRAAKIFDDKAEECCAERCTDARERPNKALCQVESARALGEISH